MATKLCRLFIFLLLAGVVGSLQPAEAQFSKLKKRAKERIEENLGRKQDKAIYEAMDEGASSDAAVSEDALVSASNQEGGGAHAQHNVAASVKPGEGACANYDFIPASGRSTSTTLRATWSATSPSGWNS